MSKSESKKRVFALFLTSLSFHVLAFALLSHKYVWSKPVRTSRPLTFRVVSVEQPREKLPPNPESRFLSNANRKESGAGKPGKAPRLKRARKERLVSRRRTRSPAAASLAPAAVAPPKPPSVKPEEPEAKKSVEVPRNKPKQKEAARRTPKASSPVPKRTTKPKRRSKAADPKNDEKKARASSTRKDRPKPVPVVRKKEKIEVAALKPIVRPRRPAPVPPQPQDPLAMFRVKPRPKGEPDAPRLELSDEEADRIAKRSALDESRGEEGDIISLDTRDSRYAPYFKDIKRKIQYNWVWPEEAQKYDGNLSLHFVLKKDGTLREVRLVRSAGVRVLDDLAMAAVTKAAPFDPFPPGLARMFLGNKPLKIKATFVYNRK